MWTAAPVQRSGAPEYHQRSSGPEVLAIDSNPDLAGGGRHQPGELSERTDSQPAEHTSPVNDRGLYGQPSDVSGWTGE